jgi:hypothetical protein
MFLGEGVPRWLSASQLAVRGIIQEVHHRLAKAYPENMRSGPTQFEMARIL